MFKFNSKMFVFVSFLFTFTSSFQVVNAGRVENLYAVELLVVDEYAATREKAFSQGLDEVFVRISGDSTVMDQVKRPPSSRYVKQFSYEPVDPPIVNDEDELLTHRLKIRYNGKAMEKYLLDNELPAWGEYRPNVVIWLVVRDGRNEYVLKDIDQSILKNSVAEAMVRRGVPTKWPVYDQVDRKVLRVSDIRGGFKEPVVQASRRYSKGPALTGSMSWNGEQWQSNWSLISEGKSQHWNISDTDHGSLINRSIDQAADVLGSIFAIHTADDNQPLASVILNLQSVDNIDDFSYVEKYLTGLSAVNKTKTIKVTEKNVVFEVLLRSNEEDFFNLVKNDAALTELDELEIEAILQADKKVSDGMQNVGQDNLNQTKGIQSSEGDLSTRYVSLFGGSSKNTKSEISNNSDKEEASSLNNKPDEQGAVGQVKGDSEIVPVKENIAESDRQLVAENKEDTKKTYYYRLNRSR